MLSLGVSVEMLGYETDAVAALQTLHDLVDTESTVP